MEAIARTFKPLWCTKRGFEVKDMENHIVLFVFAKESDADRVLMRGTMELRQISYFSSKDGQERVN